MFTFYADVKLGPTECKLKASSCLTYASVHSFFVSVLQTVIQLVSLAQEATTLQHVLLALKAVMRWLETHLDPVNHQVRTSHPLCMSNNTLDFENCSVVIIHVCAGAYEMQQF